MSDGYYLLLDIGGTKTTGAVFQSDGTPVKDVFYTAPSATYEGENAVFENTVAVGKKTLQLTDISQNDVCGIGVAAPGPLDYRTGYIIDVPMMGWKDFPLGQRLSDVFHVPVRIENDGNLGAYAEAHVGVAKGERVVLYMTVSTGCGGGIAMDGEIYRGRYGNAGEFGHVSIDLNGPPCGCGSNGCLELYASGTAINRRMRLDAKKGIRSRIFDAAGADISAIDGKLLGKAAEEGDSYAHSVLQEEGRYLGAGLAGFFNMFDPDVIVLGGGVTKSAKWFREEMMREINRRSMRPVEDSRVRFSELNDRVTIYGAYLLIKDYMEHLPEHVCPEVA